MSDDLRNTILNYMITEYLDNDSEHFNSETPLISGGIVDSFSMVSLKRFIENRYHIKIPNSRATPEAFDSVDRIVKLVEEFIAKKE